MVNANSDSFFERVSKELAGRTPHDGDGQLLIDENLTIYLPAHLIARYATDAGIAGYWNEEHGVFAIGFVKKSGEHVRDVEFAEGETVPLDARWFFTELFQIPVGKLPARFAYVVKSPHEVVEGRNPGPSDEMIVVALQWRQK